MSGIQVRPLAQQDILASAEYLDSEAGFDVAERFLRAVRAEFEALAKMPRSGALCGFMSRDARDMRRWSVTGFERWLIFYEALDSGILVARVLHGAQDIHAIFD